MAYDSRNAGSFWDSEYIDPFTDPNSWQTQANYINHGGYHGAYQQPPVAPQMDHAPQNQADAWEDFPDDWPEDLNVPAPNRVSNGYINKTPLLTQPTLQSPSPFFNPQVATAQQSFQSAPNEMANVRSGLSYAAALSGKSEEKPAKEQNNASGFDDIDLNDDSANFFSGSDAKKPNQSSSNAVNEAFGLSAPMLPAASPSAPFSSSHVDEEEPHPADALAEAFSMTGPPKSVKMASGINPFSRRSKSTPRSGGKAVPLVQNAVVEQNSVSKVLDAFSTVPQPSSPQEQSSAVSEAFPPLPQATFQSNQNDSITNSFYSPSVDTQSSGNDEVGPETLETQPKELVKSKQNDLIAQGLQAQSNEMDKPNQADLVADSFSSPHKEISGPQENDLVSGPFHTSAHEPDLVAEAFSAQAQENYCRSQQSQHQSFSEPAVGNQLNENIQNSYSVQSQEVNKLDQADLVAEVFAASSQGFFRPQKIDSSNEPDLVAEAFSAPSQENCTSKHNLTKSFFEQPPKDNGTANVGDVNDVVETFSSQTQEVSKPVTSDGVSPQNIFRPQQSDLVGEPFHHNTFLEYQKSDDHGNDVAETSSAKFQELHEPQHSQNFPELSREMENTQEAYPPQQFQTFPAQSQEMDLSKQVDVVADAFSASTQAIFTPKQNDLVDKPSFSSFYDGHSQSRIDEAFGAPTAEQLASQQNGSIGDHFSEQNPENALPDKFCTSGFEGEHQDQNIALITEQAAHQEEDVLKAPDALFGAQDEGTTKNIFLPSNTKLEQTNAIATDYPVVSQDTNPYLDALAAGSSTGKFNTEIPQMWSKQNESGLSASPANSNMLCQYVASSGASTNDNPFLEGYANYPQSNVGTNTFTITATSGSDNPETFTIDGSCPDQSRTSSGELNAFDMVISQAGDTTVFDKTCISPESFPEIVPQERDVGLVDNSSDVLEISNKELSQATSNPNYFAEEVSQKSSELLETSSSANTFTMAPSVSEREASELTNSGIVPTSSFGKLSLDASHKDNTIQSNSSGHALTESAQYQPRSSSNDPSLFAQRSRDDLGKVMSSDDEVSDFSKEINHQETKASPIPDSSEGRIDLANKCMHVETLAACTPPKLTTSPAGSNPFRRSAPKLRPSVEDSLKVSQYSPDEHNPVFAKTKVKHQRPLNVTAQFGHGTHTMSSSGKLSPFGDVTNRDHSDDNVADDVVDSHNGTNSPVNQKKDDGHPQMVSKQDASGAKCEKPVDIDGQCSTPPPVIPSTGPMAMSTRQPREKKAKTPVAMSSLWSNQNSSTGAPPFMLAPALMEPSKSSQEAPTVEQTCTVNSSPGETGRPSSALSTDKVVSTAQEKNPMEPAQKSAVSVPETTQAVESKKIDLHDPNLSKKERKAEKKRLKALAKEQKKALKKAGNVGSNNDSHDMEAINHDETQAKGNPHGRKIASNDVHNNEHKGNPHGRRTPSDAVHNELKGNPHGNPGNPHGNNAKSLTHGNVHGNNHGNPHHTNPDLGPEHSKHSNPHQAYGNPHAMPQGYHSNPHPTSSHDNPYSNVTNPHNNPHETEETKRDERESHGLTNPKNMEYYKGDLDNPRVRELRDDHFYDKSQRHEHSGRRSPSRQMDYKGYGEYSHRGYDGNGGGYSPRSSRDESSRKSDGSYVLYRDNPHPKDESFYGTTRHERENYSPRGSRDESTRDISSYGALHDNPHPKDERYHGATRRQMEKYGDQSAFDYPRRRKSFDNEHYESRRSHEDLAYLDHSYESMRSDHLPDEYYHDYYKDHHRDSSSGKLDHSGFKPIHYGDYRDSYRSHTPSSGSGRSTPTSYSNYPPHDQGYYGHYQPYPGYPPDPYGYYQGHYGHMPYPYYPYPPHPYDYYYQYGAYGSGHVSTYSSGEANYPDQHQTEQEETALDKEQPEEVQEVQPLRTTPLHFLRPHMTCRFGVGGKLLIVLPNHPEDGMKPLVEIRKLKVVFTQEEKEQVERFPGPLTCQGTMKRQVIEYIQEKADQIQRSSSSLANKQAKWVLWKFFQSLVKHNGAIVNDDVAEMLMTSVHLFEKKKKKRHSSSDSSSSDSSTDSSSSSYSSESSSSDSSLDDSEENTQERPADHLLVFRGLILEGHSKEALEYAMKNGLWGHAVLASGLMDNKGNNSMLDTKTSSGVIQRFFETLDKGDPLITLYEHLGGKVPHALRNHENWASNLAGMVANPTAFPDKDKDNIVTLGDTLAKQPELLFASHLCYLMAGIKPGSKAKMILVGCDHRNKPLNKALTIESLQLTELLEYAQSLENPEFFISSLQTFRFIHATRLMNAGLHKEALSYLHIVGDFIMKNRFAFNEVFKRSVYKTAEQLVVHMETTGSNIDLFINTWLRKLNQVIEGTDSGIYEPEKDESENEEEEDPLAQSSVSFFSGYDQSVPYNEKPSPESTGHSVISRQPSLQSSNTNITGASGHSPLSRKDSQMSVHSHLPLSHKDSILSTNSSIAPLQTLDMSQPMPAQIYQPGEPLSHKESFSSQDQADGGQMLEEKYQKDQFQTNDNFQANNQFQTNDSYQTNDQFQANDNQVQWQQNQPQDNSMNVGMSTGMFMPGTQQNNWPLPEQGGEVNSEGGEMTPVPTFDDFYNQSNRMAANSAPSWQDDISKTPTPGMQEISPPLSQPKQDAMPKTELKPKKEEKKPANAKTASGGGWFTGLSGLIQKVIPKGPNEVHLPDDTKKTIYFDKELNKWVNTDESEEDRAPPPPPPTDAMIGGGIPPGNPSSGPTPPMPMPGRTMGNMPATASMPTSANPVPGNRRDGPGTPPSSSKPFGAGITPDPSLPASLPTGSPSKFSRRAQGRLGAQKKYVDVLNPNKGSSTQSSAAVPSALFPILPPTGGGSFQGTLFVPSAAPTDDNNDSVQPPSSIQSGANEAQSSSQTNEESSQSFSSTQDFKPPQQTQFFDPSSFSSQPAPSSLRRGRGGRGRYPR